MAIPALDKTGKEYESSRIGLGGDVYYLMISYRQPDGGGVELAPYLTATLYKNEDRSNSLFPAELGGKIQMVLNTPTLQSSTKSLKERRSAWVQKIRDALTKVNISGVARTEIEIAWDSAFGLSLIYNGETLDIVDTGDALIA